MILSALNLFHLKGVKGTSVDEVLEASQTGKGQFTHYFKTKEGLIRATLQYLFKIIQSNSAPTGYQIESWSDLEGWFNRYIDFQRSVDCERSCPLGTIANDLTSEQEVLRQDVRLFLQWSESQLARFFVTKQALGELSPAADPDGLARLFLSVMQGGMLLTKMKRDTDLFEHAAKQALNYVNMLRR